MSQNSVPELTPNHTLYRIRVVYRSILRSLAWSLYQPDWIEIPGSSATPYVTYRNLLTVRE